MTKNPPTGALERASEGLSLPVGAAISPDWHPSVVYIARLAKGSRRTMRAALDAMAKLLTRGEADAMSLPWHALRYAHTQALRSLLSEKYAPSTVNKHLAALRGVLTEAFRLGLMTGEDFQRAADLASVRGTTLPVGRELTDGELRALFNSCAESSNASGARDAALLALLYGAGLRRLEAVALDLADYDASSGELRVRQGKGRKDRVVWLTNGGRSAVEAWIAIRGSEGGALLCPVNKGGKLIIRRITDQATLMILRRRARAAGVAHFTPHDLRRSFVSHLLGAGADISVVQKLAGHANVSTTQRYDRRGETAKKKAVELLHVPFVARVAETKGARP